MASGKFLLEARGKLGIKSGRSANERGGGKKPRLQGQERGSFSCRARGFHHQLEGFGYLRDKPVVASFTDTYDRAVCETHVGQESGLTHFDRESGSEMNSCVHDVVDLLKGQPGSAGAALKE